MRPMAGELPDNASLDEAKQWLRLRFEDGASCPLCSQHVKLYKRKLNSSMAVVLSIIYKAFRKVDFDKAIWLHVPSHLNNVGLPAGVAASVRGDWAKLKFWGLIEEKGDVRMDGSSRAGYWRITDVGKMFVESSMRVPKYVFIYNGGRIFRNVEDEVTFKEALGDKFSYAELMA